MLCFVACSGGTASLVGRPATGQPAQTSGESVGSTPTESATGLLVWSDAGSVDVMRSLADSFTETTGVEIVVQEVDIDDVRGEMPRVLRTPQRSTTTEPGSRGCTPSDADQYGAGQYDSALNPPMPNSDFKSIASCRNGGIRSANGPDSEKPAISATPR